MRKVMVMVLCLSLVAGLALSFEAPVIRVDEYMLNIAPTVFRGDPGDPDCHIGTIFTSFDDFGGWYSAYWQGYEDYAYRVNRINQNPCLCSEGWVLRNVQISLVLREGVVLLMQPVLYQAVSTGGEPGAIVYEGPEYLFNFPIPDEGHDPTALWIVTFTLPFVGDEDDPRECRIHGDYFLGMRFLDGGEQSPTWPYYPGDPSDPFFVGLPVNNAPVANGQYCNKGQGWLNISGMLGRLYMNAEVDCCWGQVQTEDSSLSEIKQLFR